MTGSEFIEKLKKALENDLSEAQVREQTAFYSSYIREEVRKGRSEEEGRGAAEVEYQHPGCGGGDGERVAWAGRGGKLGEERSEHGSHLICRSGPWPHQKLA